MAGSLPEMQWKIWISRLSGQIAPNSSKIGIHVAYLKTFPSIKFYQRKYHLTTMITWSAFTGGMWPATLTESLIRLRNFSKICPQVAAFHVANLQSFTPWFPVEQFDWVPVPFRCNHSSCLRGATGCTMPIFMTATIFRGLLKQFLWPECLPDADQQMSFAGFYPFFVHYNSWMERDVASSNICWLSNTQFPPCRS